MISNKGYLESFITLKTSNATAGYPVTISENNTCTSASSGDVFSGVLINERNEMGSVQTKGYVELPYTGTAPALGETKVAANGSGGITTNANGKPVTVLWVNTTSAVAAIIM